MNAARMPGLIAIMAFVPGLLSASLAAGAPPVGRFDTYVLAMSYERDFCASHPTKKECQDGIGDMVLALHGLWPNLNNDPNHTYQYCDVSESDFGKDWCNPQFDVAPQMSSSGLADLGAVMPGTKSCLYNHEWYAHGSCSGLSVADFFSDAAQLARAVISLPSFTAAVRGAAGGTISRDQLLAALRSDLGSAADDSVAIECRFARPSGTAGSAKRAYFTEVDISLSRDGFLSFPAPESFAKNAPITKPGGVTVEDAGDCPENGIFVSP